MVPIGMPVEADQYGAGELPAPGLLRHVIQIVGVVPLRYSKIVFCTVRASRVNTQYSHPSNNLDVHSWVCVAHIVKIS